MPDYSKTVIYKIQHQEDETLVYVGSTCNFTRRKCEHKKNCNDPNKKVYDCKLYEMIRKNGNWEAFKMTQIEEFSCYNKREAEAEEDRIMLELKATLYTNRASRNMKQQYLHNRDKFLERSKKRYLENHYTISEYQKQNRLENVDRKNEHNKEYRLKMLIK